MSTTPLAWPSHTTDVHARFGWCSVLFLDGKAKPSAAPLAMGRSRRTRPPLAQRMRFPSRGRAHTQQIGCRKTMTDRCRNVPGSLMAGTESGKDRTADKGDAF